MAAHTALALIAGSDPEPLFLDQLPLGEKLLFEVNGTVGGLAILAGCEVDVDLGRLLAQTD